VKKKKKKRSPQPTTNLLQEILRAEPRALALLAASDRPTWQCLVSHLRNLGEQRTCEAGLLNALLAIADLEGWQRFAFSAYNGLNPDDGMEAHHYFTEWFNAGIVLHLRSSDATALERRFKIALDDDKPSSARRTRALVEEIEKAGDSKEHRSLLGRALLLLSVRLGEEADDDASFSAALRAEEVFTAIGDAKWRVGAIRMRAGALLRLRRIDEAFALLDPIFEPSAPWTWIAFLRHRPCPSSDPAALLLFEAAKTLAWAQSETPELTRVFLSIGKRLAHEAFTTRAEAGEQKRAEQAAERAPLGSGGDAWKRFLED